MNDYTRYEIEVSWDPSLKRTCKELNELKDRNGNEIIVASTNSCSDQEGITFTFSEQVFLYIVAMAFFSIIVKKLLEIVKDY
jgi:hypothetical protein